MQYGMTIDLVRCFGCQTCVTACKLANHVPAGIMWNRVYTIGGEWLDTAAGQYPDKLSMSFLPLACQHCGNPACVKVCPVGATYKDKDTGVVRQDYDRCIGCRMCMAACPYTGIRSFNWEQPKYHIDVIFGDAEVPKHQKHVVEKCTFCWHRLAKGEKPKCVDACLGRARKYGDLEDPTSEVAQLIATRQHKQLLPEKGTNPSVYYLV